MPADPAVRRFPSSLQQGIALRGQPIELLALLRDSIGVAFLRLATGDSSGLFDQLPDIVLKDCDAILELRS
jgi:hypothetical protein